MFKRSVPILRMFVVAGLLAVGMRGLIASTQSPASLTVHEWGTFTSIAGPDGQAMQWLPLGGPTDLPCFVQTYQNRQVKALIPADAGPLLDYEQARAGLRGTVRMETPVLYFYADRETTASVSVSFPQGLFTEFYPSAQVQQMSSYANILKTQQAGAAKISWPSVNVLPGTSPMFPSERSGSHYYAARNTDAAPIQVNGQDEKFLFYRGVAGFPVPISTMLQPDGSILVRNLSRHALPGVIFLAKEGSSFSYRVHGGIAAGSEAVVSRPSNAGSLPALMLELERALVHQGLYAREAKAMVETWRDDWFNDGTRVFYFVPAPDIDAILPLQIHPAPAATVRVFVGRMEVITPRSEADVERALTLNDARLLEVYGRFLGPIGDRIVAKMTEPQTKAALLARLDAIFKAYLTRVTACE
jgi:hypothetical protein